MDNQPVVPPGGAFLALGPPANFLISERLDADTRAMAKAAGDFLRGVVLPAADRLQEQEPGLMPSLLRQAGELGLMGMSVPEEYGGPGLCTSATARIAEALAPEPSFAVSHNVHTSVATLPIVLFGTDEQKARYLSRLASGEWIGAYALSEAHAGSDALAARCRATPTPEGGYTLTGEKMWITNAAFADLFVVFAKIDGSQKLSAFLVERGFPGVSVGREEHKLGLKGSSTCRLILDSVPVPASNVLGAPDEGAKVALYTLNLGRFKIAASSLGQAKNLLGIAARYAKQRSAFGKPIAEFGLIQQKVARMAARLFACESMLYRLAGYLDQVFDGVIPMHSQQGDFIHPAEEYAIECSMVKIACTEALDYCADECLQIHGGYGYTEEFPAARAWRDARVNRIYEGTNEINRLNIVQLLLRRIDSGRVDLAQAPRVEDARPGSLESLRAAVCVALESARDTYGAALIEEQMVCGAMADMLIALFAAESAEQRSRRIVEFGASEPRWQASLLASRFARADADATLRTGFEDVFGTMGTEYVTHWRSIFQVVEPRPDNSIERMTLLGRAVIDAGGYSW